jgi:murein DD-endopeptidase MepM/ murein hydrolase activator NlpD
VDLDYRAPSNDALPEFRRGTADRSTGGLFFAPPGIPVLAAADGTIWSSSISPRGAQIVISHGKPYATYYQHLAFVRMPLLRRGAGAIKVRAGEPIGIMGNGSEVGQAAVNGFRHLHFEVWKGGGPSMFTDPAPILRTARRVAWSPELAAAGRSKWP